MLTKILQKKLPNLKLKAFDVHSNDKKIAQTPSLSLKQKSSFDINFIGKELPPSRVKITPLNLKQLTLKDSEKTLERL